jgi:peptidoglycan/xylan/chitin deacetylase (PgdA/CDA1 family)
MPPPVRRLREHLREIRRVAGETQQLLIDSHRHTSESLAALADRMARIENLIGGGVQAHSHRPATQPSRAVVLAYHRIAEPTTDPFELAVAPAQFQEHLEVLAELGHLLTVSELGSRIRNGTLPDVSFVLTFDDGYADNLHTAKPILEQYGAPATVFLTTGFLDGTSFWWDELAHLMLSGDKDREQRLTLDLDGTSRSWHLGETSRLDPYLEVWALLRALPDDRRRALLAAVRSQLGDGQPAPGRALTPEEIPDLIRNDLVDVGAHTKTHPVLEDITDQAAREEITDSKTWLEDCLGRPVTAFAYPYGRYGPREVEIVRGAAFEVAFSASGEAVIPGCDRLQVPRVPVGHWTGADLEKELIRLTGKSRTTTARPPSPERKRIQLGDLRRLTPIGQDWGFDRGTPIDRHYIERFLEPRAGEIRGRVLEMGDPVYTRMFGGTQVTQSDVLDVMGSSGATYTCRLEEGHEIPTDGFDCIVCTQVLQYIYDIDGALRTLHRVLKPGGNLLMTVPALTPIHHGDQYGDAWYWCFTTSSISRQCADVFGRDAVQIEGFGNVLAATAFLYGLASSELTPAELDHFDPDYAVTIGLQITKEPG